MSGSKVVGRLTKHGIPVHFTSRPKPFRNPNPKLPTDADEYNEGRAAYDSLAAEGRIARGGDPRFINATWTRPKTGSTERRVITATIDVNDNTQHRRTKYETLRELPNVCQPGDYMQVADIRHGYYSFILAPRYRKYFSFIHPYTNELWHWVALPMGFTLSAYFFTKLMRVPMRALRAQGVRCLIFVDDLIIFSPSHQAALRDALLVETTLNSLGLQIHPRKGNLFRPMQKVVWLGILVDTVAQRFSVPPSRLQHLAKQAASMLGRAHRHRRYVQARMLASLVGQATSMVLAIPCVPLFTRSLYSALRSLHGRLNRDIQLSKQQLHDLQALRALDSCDTRYIWREPAPEAYLFTDASNAMWGAHLAPSNSPAGATQYAPCQGFFPARMAARHINVKETAAAMYGLISFLRLIRHTRVAMMTDSRVLFHILRRFASRSPSLMELVRLIYKLARENDIQLQPRWLASIDNVLADRLSRHASQEEYSLTAAAWDTATSLLPPDVHLTVDAFASPENARCCRFYSTGYAPDSDGMDALAQSWDNDVLLLHPPIRLVGRTIAKLRDSPAAAALLIVPVWPAQPWWPILQSMATASADLTPTAGAAHPFRAHPGPGHQIEPDKGRWSFAAFYVPTRA